MTDDRPLPTLLSIALVAFTIEFDNEFEQQMVHRTTISKTAQRPDAPWLVSLVMWSNFMRFIDEGGITVREFAARARLPNDAARMWLTRMSKWWGYVVVAPVGRDGSEKRLGGDWVVRPNASGRRAQLIWTDLFAIIEERWKTRFGERAVAGLREALWTLAGRFEFALPEYLPIVGYGLTTGDRYEGSADKTRVASDAPLPALLSTVLCAFAIEFERESELSLAICANALRVLTETGVRVRDLPLMTGVSKEAIAVSIGFLDRHGYATSASDPAGARTKSIRLTPKGKRAQQNYHRILQAVEDRWRARYGERDYARLCEALREIVDEPGTERPRLSLGLQPHPGGWRNSKLYSEQTQAFVRDPSGALPHFPIVTHRGGWPDGS